EQRGVTSVELLDIIHETLLTNWPLLRDAIATQREALQQRERFRLAQREWFHSGRSDQRLLQGVRLAEARSLAERNDVALRDPEGRRFWEESSPAEVEARTRDLRHARSRQRVLATVAGAAVLLACAAVVTAVLAFNSQQVAQHQTVLAVQQTDLARSE